MKNKKIVLYSNMDIDEELSEIEREYQQEYEREELYNMLNDFFANNEAILSGVCGRWNGKIYFAKFIRSTKELLQAVGHLDYLEFLDNGGHLVIYGSHHDGQDRYEVRALTRKGERLASENWHDVEPSRLIKWSNCNLFSALPHLAKRLGMVE